MSEQPEQIGTTDAHDLDAHDLDVGVPAIDEHLHDEHVDARDDERLDAAIDDADAGGDEVRGERERADAAALADADARGELPLLLSSRERFAGIDDLVETGEARVDAATARLAELVDLPTADHVAVYDDVHRRLQDALADADAQ